MLRVEGFGPEFVEKQEIKKIPIRLQMLLAEQVPAALLPEPLLTPAESRGARVIADDRRLDTSLTVLALNGTLASRSRGLGRRFLRAYGAAVQRINREPEAFKPLLIARTRFPEPVKDRYRIPVFPLVEVPSETDITAAQKWLLQKGMVNRLLPYEEIVLK